MAKPGRKKRAGNFVYLRLCADSSVVQKFRHYQIDCGLASWELGTDVLCAYMNTHQETSTNSQKTVKNGNEKYLPETSEQEILHIAHNLTDQLEKSCKLLQGATAENSHL